MLKCWLVFQTGGKLPGDGLEFSSFGWFPQFNKVSCLNFVCISSSKMYANRYWVTKIARMRVFSFFIKITSGHRTLSRKASFWTIRILSKDYGRIWYGDRKYFSPRPSITQLRELKIPRRFGRGQCRLKMHSRLFIVYRDYSNSQLFFSASQLVYLLSPLNSNHKAIKEKNQMFYHFLWNGKGDKIKGNSCDQWIWVWRLKDDWSLLFHQIS